MSETIVLRPPHPNESAKLTAIAWAAKAHWGYPADWMEGWRAGLTLSEHRGQHDWLRVLETDDGPQGFAAVSIVDGAAELTDCWVLPSAMGQGLGRRLLLAAREWVAEQGLSKMLVVSDPNAAAFYQRHGARQIGEVASTPPGRMLPLLELVCCAVAADKVSNV